MLSVDDESARLGILANYPNRSRDCLSEMDAIPKGDVAVRSVAAYEK